MRDNFNNFTNQFNQYNQNSMKMFKYIYIISFIFQWSILSMVLNLFTLGIFRRLLFVVFILDALSMIIKEDKSMKCPSFILSKIWYIIDKIDMKKTATIISYYINRFTTAFKTTYTKVKYSLSNIKENILNIKNRESKFKKERNINKFSSQVGSKVTVEYIKPGEKLQRKTFKFKDRALSFIHLLESEGYKDYSSYNLDINMTPAYMVVNKNRDIIDVEQNKVKLSHESRDYKFVVDGWMK